MTTPLLAEANQTQGQDTAQADAATKDTQQKAEQKQDDAQQDSAGQKAKDTKPAEQKADEGKPADEKKADDKGKPEGAPELYEFEVPKGLPDEHQLDEQVLDSFAEVARDLDLSQSKAQKLLDKVVPTIHRRAMEQQAELHTKWIEAVKADKEIGGPKLDENLAVAKKAVKAYGSAELQQLLNGPLGSHPEVLRFLVKVGRKVSEDKFVGGNEGQSVNLNDEAAMAKKLYPKST